MNRLLSDRLADFAVAASLLARRLPGDPVSANLARQLARSATSPAANYVEARESSSPRDYLNRMKICVRELREAQLWLRIARRTLGDAAAYADLERECNELIAIAVTCIKKARVTAAQTG
jgi:four helix bundle protein